MRYPEVVSTKVTERDRLAIDVAADLRGVSRSRFVRDAVVQAAERELEAVRSNGQGGDDD